MAEGEGAEEKGIAWWLLRAAVALTIVAGAYVIWVAASVWLSADGDDTSNTDAIVVLGAAQYDGTPSPVFRQRLDHAKALFDDGVADTIVLTGSKQENDRFTEAYSGFTYLLGLGVPEEAMVLVSDGNSTYESLAAAARVMKESGHNSVTMVSDGYHSRRIAGIADELGLDAVLSPSTTGVNPAQLARESALVGVGEILGYRRLNRFS